RDPRAGRRRSPLRPARLSVHRARVGWPEPPCERPSLRARLPLPVALYSAARRRTSARRGFLRSGEGDGGRADDQPLALVAFEPDVELDGAGALVLLRHGPAQTDGAPREHEAAERGPQAAEHAGAGQGLDERRQEAHAHVPGRYHAGKALPPRPLVVGEAGRPLVGRPGVGPHLVLGQEELPGGKLAAFLDVVEPSRHRCMKRLSTTASISPRWFVMVKPMTTKYMLPVRPVFS